MSEHSSNDWYRNIRQRGHIHTPIKTWHWMLILCPLKLSTLPLFQSHSKSSFHLYLVALLPCFLLLMLRRLHSCKIILPLLLLNSCKLVDWNMKDRLAVSEIVCNAFLPIFRFIRPEAGRIVLLPDYLSFLLWSSSFLFTPLCCSIQLYFLSFKSASIQELLLLPPHLIFDQIVDWGLAFTSSNQCSSRLLHFRKLWLFCEINSDHWGTVSFL